MYPKTATSAKVVKNGLPLDADFAKLANIDLSYIVKEVKIGP